MSNLTLWLVLIGQFLLVLGFYVFVIEKLISREKWYYKVLSLLGGMVVIYLLAHFFGPEMEGEIGSEGTIYPLLTGIVVTIVEVEFAAILVAIVARLIVDKFKK